MPHARLDPDQTVAQPAAPDAPSESTVPAPPGTRDHLSDHTRSGATAPTHPTSPPTPGLPHVPGYAVARELARGGMGVVYAAHDPTFEREVAVKVMHDGQDAGRFVVESKVTAQLPHPGIPPVYALGELADGRPFLAMKLVRGRTLADELKAGRTDLPRLLGAFEQICLTVGFAHAQGIVHRDLKPANVMVGAFGEVLVMDWGLARQARSAERGTRSEDSDPTSVPSSALRAPRFDETQAGSVKGTPAYMSPEQARGEPVDARADVFALGGILTAVLTGKGTFGGTTAPDTVRRAAAADLADAFARLDACGADAELVAVAKKCLAPRAEGRYANGEAVAAATAAYRAGVEERLRTAERERAAAEAKAAEEVNTRREAEARVAEQRQKRKVQSALAVAVLLLTCGGGAVAWHSDRQQEQARRARAEFEAEQARQDAERQKIEAVAEERDRVARERARQGVAANLELATGLRKQHKFAPANAALEQAAELTAGAPELKPRVEQARRDLAFVVRLDDIRFRKWVWVAQPGGKGEFNTKIAAPEYKRAFADRELDLTTLAPAEAAGRIAASAIKAELVAAVDDWSLFEPDDAVLRRLLEVARRADPGPWTDRFRDPAVRKSRPALEKLAADADPATVPPPALAALAALMGFRGANPAELLSAARTAHPTSFELAFALGQWHMRRKTGEQIGPFEAARALRPDNLSTWVNLGNALHDRGRVPEALAAYREAARRDATSAVALTNLGLALRETGDSAGALAAFREAVTRDPKDGPALNSLAVVLKEKGDVSGAIAAWRDAVRHDPGDANPCHNLGLALAEKGDTAGAVAAFLQAVQRDPKLAVAHYNLGVALQSRGETDRAFAAWSEAVKHDPTLAQAHTNLGVLLKARGDTAGAIAAWREAVKHNPRQADVQFNLGLALQEKGDADGAIAAWREAVKHDPKHAKAHGSLGTALIARNDTDGAVAAWKEAVKLDIPSAATHYDLGVALHSRGDLDGALAAFKGAVKYDPKHTRAYTNLGGVYYKQKKFAEAAAAAREAIKLEPRFALAHALLGNSLLQSGDRDGARAAMTEAAGLDPKTWQQPLERLFGPPLAPPPREKK